MCLPHLPLIRSLLQLLAFAQLADLFARLAVQAVCAAAAVFSAQAGSAGAALLPPLLLKDQGAVRGRVQRVEREKPGLLVLALDVPAQRRRVSELGWGLGSRWGSGHGGCLLGRSVGGTIKTGLV